MNERTCAACDCKLDSDAIKVKIGGKTVELCCDDCAQKLRESHASAATPGKGLTAVLAIGVLSALFLAHPDGARASTPEVAPPTQRVSYEDIDLSKPADVEKLYARLRHAARKVCASYAFSVRSDADRRWSDCVTKATSDAVSDVGNPALTARHLARQRVKAWPLHADR